jgi:putative transposase
MREEGLLAAPRKRFKVTTHSEHSLQIAKNIIDREFSIKTPDTVWAMDITYARTWEGRLYLAVVLDLFSRRVVGWSMATHMRTEGALGALNMALGRRSPAHKCIITIKCIITVTEEANIHATTIEMR